MWYPRKCYAHLPKSFTSLRLHLNTHSPLFCFYIIHIKGDGALYDRKVLEHQQNYSTIICIIIIIIIFERIAPSDEYDMRGVGGRTKYPSTSSFHYGPSLI